MQHLTESEIEHLIATRSDEEWIKMAQSISEPRFNDMRDITRQQIQFILAMWHIKGRLSESQRYSLVRLLLENWQELQ